MDLFPRNLVLLTVVWGFFELPIDALAGARLYQE